MAIRSSDWRVVTLGAIAWLSAAAAAVAIDCIDYAETMHWVTRLTPSVGSNAIALAGDRAYLVNYGTRGLVIVDVSEPTRPARLGEAEVPGWGADVCVVGDLAFVAALIGGLQVVDVANPAAPVVVGSLATEAYASDVAATAGLVLVGEWESGVMTVVDVTDPTSPVAVGSFTGEHQLADLAAAEGFAYVLGENDFAESVLSIIDLADPTQPAVAATVPVGPWSRGVDVAGGIACVAGSGWLLVIDVSDPRSPEVIGQLNVGGGPVAIDGSRVYLPRGTGGVRVVDIATPAAPVMRGEVMISDECRGFAGAGPYLFTANTYSGLNVIDVTTPDSALAIGELNPPNYTLGLTMVDGRLYVGGSGRLRIVDASYPAEPFQVGELPTPGTVRSVVAGPDLAYVVDDSTGLDAVDVSDPAAPAVVGHWATDGEPLDPALADGHLLTTRFAPDGTWDLSVLDLADPVAPAMVGSVALPAGADELGLAGRQAYVACAQALVVVDWSDPAEPRVAGQVAVPENHHYRILVDYPFVYVGTEGWGVQVVDVSQPAAPAVVAVLLTPGAVRGLAVVDDILYTAASGGGYLVHDVADPSHPQLVGGGRAGGIVGGQLRDVVADARLVVLSQFDYGLRFCYPQCAGGVPVFLADFTARLATDGVRLDWRADLPDAEVEFRLSATQAGRQWAVLVRSAEPGSYHALDDDPRRDRSRPATYNLDGRLAGGDWFALGSRTVDGAVPAGLTALRGVSPNPFNPRTTITFAVDREQRVELAVFDLTGRRLIDLVAGVLPAGDHALVWDGRAADGHALPCGIYLLRLATDDRSESRKLSLVR